MLDITVPSSKHYITYINVKVVFLFLSIQTSILFIFVLSINPCMAFNSLITSRDIHTFQIKYGFKGLFTYFKMLIITIILELGRHDNLKNSCKNNNGNFSSCRAWPTSHFNMLLWTLNIDFYGSQKQLLVLK